MKSIVFSTALEKLNFKQVPFLGKLVFLGSGQRTIDFTSFLLNLTSFPLFYDRLPTAFLLNLTAFRPPSGLRHFQAIFQLFFIYFAKCSQKNEIFIKCLNILKLKNIYNFFRTASSFAPHSCSLSITKFCLSWKIA